ncbi:MAG: quinolinate synthase NadA [Ruminococcaceae bacterium]|nr:quinolinate synthase NadA [Oscillospiraceae bacterium]
MINDIQEKILKLKKEKNCCILAHSYVAKEITEVADFVGDSFQLSAAAKNVDKEMILFCGVHFMAETAKILSPDKKVVLAAPHAGCPMAEQFTPDEVVKFKNEHPDYAVVSYINTTAALKCVTDVCVTSASALNVVGNMEEENILFIPDINLGSYVKENFPQKNIVLWNGGCPVHGRMTSADAEKAKSLHPDALLLVHPECPPEVCEKADYIGSTGGIMKYVDEHNHDEYIIGTEISIAELLSYKYPDKKFYPMHKGLICPDMKETTLMDVYKALLGTGGLEIEMSDEYIKKASGCINRMLELNK